MKKQLIVYEDEEVIISRICTVTDKIYIVTCLATDYALWKQGSLAQDVFPYLSIEERDFLITNRTPREWKQIFGDDDEAY